MRIFFAIASLLLLGSCGFEPVYATRTVGSAQAIQVAVDPIPGRPGQIFKAALEDRLNPEGSDSSQFPYGLVVAIDVNETAGAIEPDGSISRYNLVFKSSYRLYEKATGRELTHGSVRRMGSYNVGEADYSNFIAQSDAIKRNLVEMSEDYRMRLVAFFARPKP